MANWDQLIFHLDKEFGSQTENYRQNIRQHIVKNHSLTEPEIKTILNLDLLPKAKNHFFSISHTQDFGGYVVSPEPVGFDLEKMDRLNPEVVKRISTPDECQLFIDLRQLWPIKESLVKLFTVDRSNPPLASQFKVKSFKDGQFETDDAFGFIRLEDSYFFAISFFKK